MPEDETGNNGKLSNGTAENQTEQLQPINQRPMRRPNELPWHVQNAIAHIIDSSDNLSDLSTNKIKDSLVSLFGRTYLNSLHAEIKSFVRQYITRDVNLDSIHAEVMGVYAASVAALSSESSSCSMSGSIAASDHRSSHDK